MEAFPVAALRARAPASVPSEQEPVGVLVARLGTDVTRIIRAEIGLFQVRVSSALQAAKGASAGLAVGAVLGVVGLTLVMLGVVFLLARIMPLWGAAFALGGALVVVAAIVTAIMIRTLRQGVHTALAVADPDFTDEALRHGE
jgi:hypothetical protein